MLNTETPDTDGKPAEASRARFAPVPLPRLCSIKRACVEWGDCGKTRFYEIVREYKVELHKIGSKTVVSGEDVGRVANEILSATRKAALDAKALAGKSVESRRERHSSSRATSPPATPARRPRRGSSSA
jgi:hypothetical protein